jgi:hypothetical protein
MSDRQVDSQYIIITVEKHLRLHRHTIQLYFPRTGKVYTTSLYHHDVLRMSQRFSKNIFSTSTAEYQHLLQLYPLLDPQVQLLLQGIPALDKEP